jgi:hypothetical protein
MKNPFHISLPCRSVKQTKEFYKEVIGASLGRSNDNWVDINLYGHQLTFTKAGKFNFSNPNYVFEGKILPSFHFGIIMDTNAWKEAYSKLSELDLEVVTEATFLKDKKGEHSSFFIKDPNEYMLEFKCFREDSDIFAL